METSLTPEDVERIKQDGVREYVSNGRKEAAAKLWARFPTRSDRKRRTAVPQYARQVRLHGAEEAGRWLLGRFPGQEGLDMLASPQFSRQREGRD